jgi:hypothetical protein
MRQLVLGLLLAWGIAFPVSAQPSNTFTTRFEGGYVAAGVSYGFTDPILIASLADYSLHTLRPHGASFTGVAGYNFQFGQVVFGIEFGGRIGREKDTRDAIATLRAGSLTLTTSEHQRMGTSASLYAALRGGWVIGNTMLFVKVGGGGTEFRTELQSQSHSEFCVTFGFVNGGVTCTQFGTFDSQFDRRFAGWFPSAVGGAGIEYDYRSLFFRLEGEAEAVFEQSSRDEVFWIGRAKALVGVRF